MSQTVQLASGTWVKMGGHLVQLSGAVNALFPDAENLDAVAEILAASARRIEDPTGVSAANLALNAAAFNREVVAGADGLGGYPQGTSLAVTYGPRGERIYTSQGAVPTLIPATTTIEDATDTIITANFTVNLISPLNDYKTGFSCKVDGVARVINAAARQADHKQIKFTLAAAVTVGQVVLLSYDIATGDVEAESGGGDLQSFVDAVVSNNVV